jgi:hypothetical protein
MQVVSSLMEQDAGATLAKRARLFARNKRSLTDLERATERFSDPDGPRSKQQAESSFHDLKANVAADEAFQLERNTGFLVGLAAIADGGEQGQIGRYHWRKMHDPEGDWISVTVDGEPGDLGDDISHLLTKGHELVSTGKVAEDLKGELGRILESVKPAARRERIKAATKALEDGKPGEFKHRRAVPRGARLSPLPLRRRGRDCSRRQLHDRRQSDRRFQHRRHAQPGRARAEGIAQAVRAAPRRAPEVRYVHGYRMSGARAKEGAGETEIWLELTDKGAKLHREDPRPAAEQVAEKPPLDLGEQRIRRSPLASGKSSSSAGRCFAPARPTPGHRRPGAVRSRQSTDVPLGEEGEEISADDLLAELEADDKAIATLKGCL